MNRVIKVLVVSLGYIALGYHSGHAGKDGYKPVSEMGSTEERPIRARMKPNISFQIVEELKKKHSPEEFRAMAEAAAKNLERDAARGFFYREQIEKAQEKARRERVRLQKQSEMEEKVAREKMARSKREREQENHTPTAVAH